MMAAVKTDYISDIEIRIRNKLNDMFVQRKLDKEQIEQYQPIFTVSCHCDGLAYIYEIKFTAVIGGEEINTDFAFGHRAGSGLPDLSEIGVIVESAFLRLGNTIRKV